MKNTFSGKSSGQGNPGSQRFNLRTNGTFRFQIGLLIALLLVFGGLEASFRMQGPEVPGPVDLLTEEAEWQDVKRIKVESDRPKKVEKKEKRKTVDRILVEDDPTVEEVTETLIETDPTPEDVMDVGDVPYDSGDDEPETVPFVSVEQYPIFPGCERIPDRDAQRDCFETSVRKHVGRHFKYNDAILGLGLSGRVSVKFRIDEKGQVDVIEVRGPHRLLEEEAVRVIEKLPEIVPAKMRDRNVRVNYTVSIKVQIDN